MKCETCKNEVESVNEADMCEDCHDAYIAEQYAYYKPLYEGKRVAGLHQGLTQREMYLLKN